MKKNYVQQAWKGFYNKYSLAECLLLLCKTIVLIVSLDYFFYKSILALLGLCPLTIVFLMYETRRLDELKRQTMKCQFKEMISCIAANMRAGYSVEKAFYETMKEMRLLFGENALIVKQLKEIKHGLDNNITIEELMLQFARKSDVEEIKEFAEIFKIAKRSGGNMVSIVQRTVSIIQEKMDVEDEIQVVIAEKRLEMKVMMIVPFGIILYISTVSKGYFDILYDSMIGRIVMTGCLIVYLAAVYLALHISTVKV